LKARWQTDVLDLKPDWLSIMIGINDVWRQYDQPLIPESHVDIEEYEKTLRELVLQTKPLLKGLVLMTPFYIEPNKNDAMRATMDRYGQVVKRIAEELDAVFVDTQAAFDRMLEHIYPATLAWDRVHPGMPGHVTLARAFLDAIGFEWKGSK
jgi:lysophospholipase L1-like esterase